LPEFDVAMLDEALTVVEALRAQSAIKLSNAVLDRQKQLLGQRNRFVTLLQEKVRIARRAARFVFRNHPEVARLFGSAYERKRRARTRAAAKNRQQQASASDTTELTGTTQAAS
jgi:hypothetical protein